MHQHTCFARPMCNMPWRARCLGQQPAGSTCGHVVVHAAHKKGGEGRGGKGIVTTSVTSCLNTAGCRHVLMSTEQDLLASPEPDDLAPAGRQPQPWQFESGMAGLAAVDRSVICARRLSGQCPLGSSSVASSQQPSSCDSRLQGPGSPVLLSISGTLAVAKPGCSKSRPQRAVNEDVGARCMLAGCQHRLLREGRKSTSYYGIGAAAGSAAQGACCHRRFKRRRPPPCRCRPTTRRVDVHQQPACLPA